MADRPDSARAVAAFWDSSREYYEQAAAANAELAAERAALLQHLRGDERLLDLGCGSCENALWIPRGCCYVGIDVSTVALLMAREQGRPAVPVRGDGVALPFADGGFDAVLSTWVLEHLHDPGLVFAEVARVLRPGGLLLLTGSAWDLPYEIPPSLPSGRRLEVAVRRLLRQLRWRFGRRHRFELVRRPRVLSEGYVPDADAVYVVQSQSLVRYLEALGFEIVVRRCLRHGQEPAGVRGAWRRLLRAVPLWRYAWGNLLVVARRGERVHRPPYRLAYL